MTVADDSKGAPQPVDVPAVPRLSVVVAAVDVEETIGACLTALLAATAHIPSEIVVVDASTDLTRDRIGGFPAVRTITAPPGTLVPRLWALGFHATRGASVSFTLGQLCVCPSWADRLMAALTDGVAGVGGALALGAHTPAATWALFYLRYSAFIESRWQGGPVSGEIAGDNALYRRSDLEACEPFDAAGFWEVEIHRQLRRRGRALVAATGATATLTGRTAPARVLRERLRHGRRFGAARVSASMSRARLVAAAPLVPAVLIGRAARRVWPSRGHRRRFLGGAPWMCLFASAWALGEAAGALSGDRHGP